MAAEPPTLLSLPSEILHTILSNLRTTHLLPLTRLCHRLHSSVLRLLYQRLTTATHLPNTVLLLECYPPSGRLFEPALPCTYLGTDGLDDSEDAWDTMLESATSPAQQLRVIGAMCSRFRPHRSETGRKPWAKHPAGDVPGSRTYTPPVPEAATAGPSTETEAKKDPPMEADKEEQLVTQTVHLDSAEMFTQLCAQTFLATRGTKPGLFHQHVDINQGVIRVFRKWLAGQVASAGVVSEDKNANVLWANDGEQLGIRLKVKQRSWKRDMPLIVNVDEDDAVLYEIQYEETLIKSMHLLLKLEQDLFDEKMVSARALMYL